jgi:hypothetical protein
VISGASLISPYRPRRGHTHPTGGGIPCLAGLYANTTFDRLERRSPSNAIVLRGAKPSARLTYFVVAHVLIQINHSLRIGAANYDAVTGQRR